MGDKLFYIAGFRPIVEALDSKRNIEKVLFKQGLEGAQFRALVELLREKGITMQFVPIQKLNSLTKANHQGVIALLPHIDYLSIEEMISIASQKSKSPVILILDGVSDVRNFGAIARSAECAGAQGIILPAKGSANLNADAIKTSAGALLRIPVSKVSNIREAIYYLKQSGYSIIASTEKGDKSLYEASFKEATAIVMGGEEKGISKNTLELCDVRVKIPMEGDINSLNVSAAATVVLFEALRQRQNS